MSSVIVYSGPGCPYCERAKALLKKKGVAFEDIDVRAHPEKREEMIELSGGKQTIPQIFINGQHIGGSDDLHALEKAGKLDKLLAS